MCLFFEVLFYRTSHSAKIYSEELMATESSDFEKGNKQTMEAVSEFLQSTKRAVEHLCEQVQASKQRRPDGVSAFDASPSSGKGFHQPMADDGTGKADQSRSWSVAYSSTSLDERLSQSKVSPSEKVALGAYRTLSEPEMEHAVGIFLRDVKRTVDAWCSRYHLLADGKVCFDAMPPSLHTNMQVMDQLDAMPQPLQVVAVNKRLLTASHTFQNRAHSSVPSLQGTMGSLETAQNIELSQQAIGDAQEAPPSGSDVENRKMNMNHKFSMEGQDFANCKNGDVDMQKASTNNGESGESIVGEGAIVKLGSPDKQEKNPTENAESPVDTDELTIRRYRYKVEVVESPDWLPKGWITELKTRGTGGSAGCKDKYYFDPVSKRRCRSQKEVFCFLATGKLGRYKRRLKIQPANKLPGIDLEQQINNSNELQTTNKHGVSGTRTSAFSEPNAYDNTPCPLAAFPGTGQRGAVGSTFLPYRPGQTSDFLYESMANLSRPEMDQYRFMDPSSSKSNSDRNSASRPWFLANAENSTRSFFDRLEMDKMDKGGGQGFARGRHGTEGASKRARKSSKRSAS